MYFEIKSKSAVSVLAHIADFHKSQMALVSSTLRVSTRVYGDSLKASASLAFIPHMPRDVIVDIVMERKLKILIHLFFILL